MSCTMNRKSLAARAAIAAAATALLLPLAAHSQNIATVNGKAVPKARLDILVKQAERAGQQVTPELQAQAKDQVVLREIFAQEAERTGVPATADYKAQMELARQSIMIRELFENFSKKNPVTDADIQAEYDKFKAQSTGTEYRARHILVETEDEAKALIAQIKGGGKFDELAKAKSKDPGSGANGGGRRPASMRSWRSQRCAMPGRASPAPASCRPRGSSRTSAPSPLAGGEVQAAGGLVGQQHRRLDDEGARQRHALLLAARQHARVVAQALAQAHALQHLGGGPDRASRRPSSSSGSITFSSAVRCDSSWKLWNTKPICRARTAARASSSSANRSVPATAHGARGGHVQPGQDGQQRALARPRGADDGHRLPFGEIEVDVMENGQCAGGVATCLVRC
jgi:hypothetical protein